MISLVPPNWFQKYGECFELLNRVGTYAAILDKNHLNKHGCNLAYTYICDMVSTSYTPFVQM